MIVNGLETWELRPRAEIEAEYDRVCRQLQEGKAAGVSPEHLAYPEGGIAALEWVLGKTNRSPVVDLVDVDGTDPKELKRESDWATKMLHREIEMHSRGNVYVAGVDRGLYWAAGQVSDDELGVA